jgi:flagellar biosynthesis/type III secretory pathway M-ring protein FliF/YscJ
MEDMTTDTSLLILEQLTYTNTLISFVIVLVGIVLSFIIVRFLWRLLFKPILRGFIKLPL